MLSYKNRLTVKKDFESAYRFGDFFSFEGVSLKVRKNNVLATRIGISVGIKFSKKAVERNKARRRLREIMRQNLEKMKKGLDVVIVLKNPARTPPSFKNLKRNLETALRKGNLII